MKRTGWKKTVAVVVAAGVLSIGVAAFATEALTPAEILQGLTGKTQEEVQAARAEGDTYGTQAGAAGVLDDFKQKMLENRKAIIEERVKEGRLSREQANEMIAAMEENLEDCDGTGMSGDRIGQRFGAGFGMGGGCGLADGTASGQGYGRMMRDGSGTGTGMGRGMGGGRFAR